MLAGVKFIKDDIFEQKSLKSISPLERVFEEVFTVNLCIKKPYPLDIPIIVVPEKKLSPFLRVPRLSNPTE